MQSLEMFECDLKQRRETFKKQFNYDRNTGAAEKGFDFDVNV